MGGWPASRNAHSSTDIGCPGSPGLRPGIPQSPPGGPVLATFNQPQMMVAPGAHSARKTTGKLRYLHRNPVTQGLAARPEDWPWSSYRHYASGIGGTVEIESFRTAWARNNETLIPLRAGSRASVHPQLDHARYETKATRPPANQRWLMSFRGASSPLLSVLPSGGFARPNVSFRRPNGL